MTTATLEINGLSIKQKAALELLRRRVAKKDLMKFSEATLPGFMRSDHLDQIADRLEAIEKGKINRLMIFAPPRHGKTEVVSVRFPAMYLGKHQQAQIIATSYAESLAYSNSWSVRTTIESPQYQRLWPLTLDRSGAVRWQLADKENNRASYIAAGVGGGITGEGANLLLIDDPVKNKEEAESEVVREKIWSWYRTVARTRLQPDAAVVLVMTRWHTADLAGKLVDLAKTNPKADQWEVLHLKAIDNGKALWPERYPLEELEKIRESIGGRDFEALYQGNPTIAEGSIFKRDWWKYYSVRPSMFLRIIHSWDTAFKIGEDLDPTVCTVWGETYDGYYLLDVWRRCVEFPELKKTTISMFNRDRSNAVLIEDKASGQSLIQEIRKTRIPVLAIKVDKDKVARANACTPLIQSGKVFLPEYAPWLFDYIEELSGFPHADHDDQVDSTTQALNWMNSGVGLDEVVSGSKQSRWRQN
jgi:predicted phage terminase large subunit-like protein